ncbi:MAG: 4Fe-4S binding protein, partial [Nitrospinota bacterium]
ARGWPIASTEAVRLACLSLGAAWTLALAWRTAGASGARGARRAGAVAALGLGVAVIIGAWWPVLF